MENRAAKKAVQIHVFQPKPLSFAPVFSVKKTKKARITIPSEQAKRRLMLPLEAPTQENKKPQPSPNALALAMTNKNNGKNGKKASSKGKKMPGNGPKRTVPFN